MTYVVAEPCVNCRYRCAMVCPVDAVHPDEDMLVHKSETCSTVTLASPKSGRGNFPEADVPEKWAQFTEVNSERSLSGLPIYPSNAAKLVPMCH